MFNHQKFIERQLHTGPPTKLLNFEDAMQFVMVLPGKTATIVRQQFAKIIERYMAGDQSLHVEIDTNATSSHPIAQMARESLGVRASSSPEPVGFKRRREELELLKMEEEIKGMTQARILGLKAELEKLSDSNNSKLDEPTRLMFKQTLQNLLVNKGTTAPQAAKEPEQIEPATTPSQEIIKNFLSSLVADTSSLVTRIKARDLHKEYMDYHAALKGSADCMLNEVLFGRALKNFPGVRKTRGQTCIIYTLDHAAIRQSLA